MGVEDVRAREEYRGLERLTRWSHMTPKNRLNHFLIATLFTAFLAMSSGCAIVGVAANAAPQKQAARYKGLAGQSVGLMVWADRAIIIDWPQVQLDLGNSIQTRLNAAAKSEELKGVTYPYPPASFVRYQRDNPGVESQPITTVAPRLGVSRLIYIEIEDLRTRARDAIEMYRGSMTFTIKVIEISGGVARIAYTENNVRAVFPKGVREEGLPDLRDYDMYAGTVMQAAMEIANRFSTHEVEK